MTWTETTRPHYERGLDRYASDCTDEEWAIIEPFMLGRSRVGRQKAMPSCHVFRCSLT